MSSADDNNNEMATTATSGDNDDNNNEKKEISNNKKITRKKRMQLRVEKSLSRLTQTETFKKVVSDAFNVCDNGNTGYISKDELYAGVLWVHVYLARYAGVAACFPPTREVVDKLFEVSDVDHSGTIDKDEFETIMIICCAQIFSRMIAYYTMIIMMVPIVAKGVTYCLVDTVDFLDDKLFPKLTITIQTWYASLPILLQKIFDWDMIALKIINFLIFAIVIPYLFGKIDSWSKRDAEKLTETKRKARMLQQTTTTTTDETENETKKNE